MGNPLSQWAELAVVNAALVLAWLVIRSLVLRSRRKRELTRNIVETLNRHDRQLRALQGSGRASNFVVPPPLPRDPTIDLGGWDDEHIDTPKGK